jgi:hypothetical protein
MGRLQARPAGPGPRPLEPQDRRRHRPGHGERRRPLSPGQDCHRAAPRTIRRKGASHRLAPPPAGSPRRPPATPPHAAAASSLHKYPRRRLRRLPLARPARRGHPVLRGSDGPLLRPRPRFARLFATAGPAMRRDPASGSRAECRGSGRKTCRDPGSPAARGLGKAARHRTMWQMTALDLDFVRSQFPAFASPVLSSHAFFENAGGSYPCRQVVDRLHRFYATARCSPMGPIRGRRRRAPRWTRPATRLAAMMGVAREEVSFGPSTSQHLCAGAGGAAMAGGAGWAIVVTDQDHEANSGVWRRLAESRDRGARMAGGPRRPARLTPRRWRGCWTMAGAVGLPSRIART